MNISKSQRILALFLALSLFVLSPLPVRAAGETAVTSLTLNKTSVEVGVGGTAALAAIAEPTGADTRGLRWSSSDESIATVSTIGVVTGVAIGTCVVTATLGSITATCNVTVLVPVQDILLRPEVASLEPGETQNVSATVNPSTATHREVEWRSSDEDVASVAIRQPDQADGVLDSSMAVITAHRAGVANIMAYSGDVNSRACVVTVSGIVLSENMVDVLVGGTQKLSYTSYGNARNISGNNWSWESDDTSVARVDPASGQVTAVAEGTTNIRCISSNGVYADVCIVNVIRDEASTVRYTMTGSSMLLTELLADIEQSCIRITQSSLNYVTGFTLRTSQGTLYENYLSEADTGAGVATAYRYFRNPTGTERLLSSISFVPKPGFNGEAVIGYIGYAINGKFYNGQLVITVQQPLANITYNSYGGNAVRFTAEDFSYYTITVTGRPLRYVTFSLPSVQVGSLMYHNLDGDLYEGPVTEGTRYMRNVSPSVDNVWFVPRPGYSGTFYINFKGSDTAGIGYDGSIRINVSYAAEFEIPEISYTLSTGQQIKLRYADFDQVCYNATGVQLDHIWFTDLPDAKEGTLYYSTAERADLKVEEGINFYIVAESTRPLIYDIRFEPATGYTGTFRFHYGGINEWNESYAGSIRVTVTSNGSNDILYTVESNQRLSFRTADFTKASYALLDEEFDYLYFEDIPQVTQGQLYAGGNPIHSIANAYYATGTMRPLDTVTFTPTSGFAGLVTIPFTAYGLSGAAFSGTVTITVAVAPGFGETLVYYTTGPAVSFRSEDFGLLVTRQLGTTLESIRFVLPDASVGRLCLNYISPTQYTMLSGNQDYSLMDISNISFQPHAGFSGTAHIAFTAYNAGGRSFNGTAMVQVSQPTASTRFSDLGAYPWAVPAVDFLRYYGIINGVSLHQFDPTGETKRGDYVLMLSRAFSFTDDSISSFSDVPAWAYYSTAIAAAERLGIASGSIDEETGERLFHPEDPITRQDAAVLLYRCMSRMGSLPSGSLGDLNYFSDRGDIDAYAEGPLAALVRLGVFYGDANGRMNPKQYLTRAEMAVLFYRAIT